MLKPERMLIITTKGDISLHLFLKPDRYKVDYVYYTANYYELQQAGDYDFVYFRDPFNDGPVQPDKLRAVVDTISQQNKSAYFVDGVKTYDELLFEDKWRQYQSFSEFMPKTSVLERPLVVHEGSIIKKRISSRSRGIVLKLSDFPSDARPEDYIVQERLDIVKEYRVYMIGGNVVHPLAVRASKTQTQKAKLLGLDDKIHPGIISISQEIYKLKNYDLMGLDIAETKDSLALLEVNRSCQFKAFYRLSSINLATLMHEFLQAKIEQ